MQIGRWVAVSGTSGPLSRAAVKDQGVKINVVGDLQAAACEERDTEGCRLDCETGQDWADGLRDTSHRSGERERSGAFGGRNDPEPIRVTGGHVHMRERVWKCQQGCREGDGL